jgi:hypothetical protein
MSHRADRDILHDREVDAGGKRGRLMATGTSVTLNGPPS